MYEKEKDTNETIEIDIISMLSYFLKHWYYFVFSVLITTVVGLAICLTVITPQFRSTTKILILNRQNSDALQYSDFQISSQLTKDYEELIESRDVIESVIEKCGLEDTYEQLVSRVSISNTTDTHIISISVEDPDPQVAQTIANTLRDTASEHITSVTDVQAVNIAEKANLPTEAASPSKLIWAVVSAGIGGLAMLIFLVIRYISDDSIKSEADVEQYLGLPTLALIPKMETAVKSGRSSGKKRKRSSSSNRSSSKSSSASSRQSGSVQRR